MKKLILLSILLIVGCDEYAPTEHTHTDCEGVAGGTAELDNCNVCDTDKTNDCVPDCADVWGGSAVEDCTGVCGGDAVLDGCAICDSDISNDGVKLWDECYNIAETDTLDLSISELIGEIPPEVGQLTNLTYLNLDWNQLTGDIPPEIGNLTNLEFLNLSDNQFIGEIPSEIWELTNLTRLYLSDNQLTGEIPSEIGNLTNLIWLYLQSNQLTGEIPPEIGNLTNLIWLRIDYNQLSGEIPSEIGNLTNLTYLRLDDNQLSGEIPQEVCDLIESNSLLINGIISGNNLTNTCEETTDGCMDDGYQQWSPNYGSPACNFNPDAIVDDGSCLYDDECGVCGGDGSSCSSTVTDIDGNVYETIQIGEQLWMAENLKVTHYNDGSEIPTGYSNSEWGWLDMGAYAVYDDDPVNADIYGNLYNWYAVDDNRGICPEDWHVPTDADWTVLTDYLGGADVVGGMMKSTGTIEEGDGLWYSPNIAATNESGFTAYPGGYRHISDGLYYHLGNTGNYWSSTKEPDTDFVFYRVLFWDYSYVHNIAHTKNYGFSVRCIND